MSPDRAYRRRPSGRRFSAVRRGFFDVGGKTAAYDAITAAIAPHPLGLIPPEFAPIAIFIGRGDYMQIEGLQALSDNQPARWRLSSPEHESNRTKTHDSYTACRRDRALIQAAAHAGSNYLAFFRVISQGTIDVVKEDIQICQVT